MKRSGPGKSIVDVEPQSRKQAMWQKRRLITLISAGRNRIVMIRRELPRTSDAGWAAKPYRIKVTRVLLPRAARPAACFVASTAFIMVALTAGPFQPAIPSCWQVGCAAAGARQGRAKRVPFSLDGWQRRDKIRAEGMAGQRTSQAAYATPHAAPLSGGLPLELRSPR